MASENTSCTYCYSQVNLMHVLIHILYHDYNSILLVEVVFPIIFILLSGDILILV